MTEEPRGSLQIYKLLRFVSVLSSFSSCSAAGVLGGSKEAIHEGCAAGEAEK